MKNIARRITLMGLMIALVVVARTTFANLPLIKPVTFIIMFYGTAFGKRDGLTLGVLGGLASNLLLGFGPWSIYQMVAWGLLGFIGGILGEKGFTKIWQLAIAGFLAGFIYGAITNLEMFMFYTANRNVASWLALQIASFPFDLEHAIGNLVSFIVLTVPFREVLKRGLK